MLNGIDIKNKLEDIVINNKEYFEAVNWNNDVDGYSQVFWSQFIKQFWVDTEISIGKDKKQYKLMTEAEKTVFKYNFAALTLFDTLQSEEGMPYIKESQTDKVQRAVLGFMEMMESIHAKSYSTIFTTLLEKYEIDEVFEWARTNKFLQKKIAVISYYYRKANSGSAYDKYMAKVLSVYLESFLFYSGFYYPLLLAGNGRMMASADMVNLIIRDESLHGVYVGMLAQTDYEELTEEEKRDADTETYEVLRYLVENEVIYTHEVYGVLNGEIVKDVIDFVKYNADKALMNLGKPAYYNITQINPIIQNGLDTETKIHDFFSVKGNGYIKANTVQLEDHHFDEVFEAIEESERLLEVLN